MTSPSLDPTETPETKALLEAMEGLLLPLARLAVGRGMQFAVVEERLKMAFVQAAREANPGGLPHRQVSRISTTTGINRREVTRLVNSQLQEARPPRSHAGELYTHWLTSPVYRDFAGQPLPLPRSGPAPSFETLARSVTNDVHPRSLLAEMLRLGFAVLDEAGDTVQVQRDALVPRADMARNLRVLGTTVGSHFSAAVANVLSDGRQHFDQLITAGELSDASMDTVKKLINAQWRATLDGLVPAIERLIEEDRQLASVPVAEPAAAPALKHRIMVGMYAFSREDDAPIEPVTGDKI